MKLHTENIHRDDVFAAARKVGIYVNELTEHGSRSHDHAFNVYLEGSSNRDSNGRDHKSATWDEWGMFMSELYEIDESAMWGAKAYGYKGEEDFHYQTGERFMEGTPSDLHIQHKWVYDYQNSRAWSGESTHKCNGCSAVMRRR